MMTKPLPSSPPPSRLRARIARAVLVLLAFATLLFVPGMLEAAQDAGTRQMRHFWHVFAAYAVAWLLVFGWAVSIARRLRRVEEKLGR